MILIDLGFAFLAVVIFAALLVFLIYVGVLAYAPRKTEKDKLIVSVSLSILCSLILYFEYGIG